MGRPPDRVAPTPIGRQEVSGEVTNVVWKDLGDGEGFYTMRVKARDDYGTWYCSVSIPKGIRDIYAQTEMHGMAQWLTGKYVGLTATLVPSRRTENLAYGRRPANGRLI